MISYLLIHCRRHNGRGYPLRLVAQAPLARNAAPLRERQVQLFLMTERVLGRPVSFFLHSFFPMYIYMYMYIRFGSAFRRLSILTTDRVMPYLPKSCNRCYVGRPHCAFLHKHEIKTVLPEWEKCGSPKSMQIDHLEEELGFRLSLQLYQVYRILIILIHTLP